MQVWARFLNSPEGKSGLQYLRLSCPKKEANSDNDLIRNAVGFDFWQDCITEMERLGIVPEKPERQEEDQLER